MSATPTARRYVEELEARRTPEKREEYEVHFQTGPGGYGEGDTFIGVRMGEVFALAKEFIGMEPQEIEKLLESPLHEARAGALSIMDKQGRSNKTSDGRRKELFDLYLRRTDRINNLDLVDLGAPYLVGRYLFDKPREVEQVLHYVRQPEDIRSLVVSGSAVHPIKILMDGGFSTPFYGARPRSYALLVPHRGAQLPVGITRKSGKYPTSADLSQGRS